MNEVDIQFIVTLEMFGKPMQRVHVTETLSKILNVGFTQRQRET